MAKKTYTVVRADIYGLKCDARGCGYRDDTIQIAQYRDHINAPCPKCGAPLLTEADFIAVAKQVMVMSRVNALANRWLPEWLLRRWDVSDHTRPASALRVELNGTGKASFTVEKT